MCVTASKGVKRHMLDLCSRCNWILGRDGMPHRFSVHDQEDMVRNVIEPMASNGMRTICVAYKDYVYGNYLNFINITQIQIM